MNYGEDRVPRGCSAVFGVPAVLDDWEAQLAFGGTATNLLTDQEYLDAQLGGYRAAESRAETATVASEAAGQNTDDYVLTTLLFASALFFAGVTTSFRLRLRTHPDAGRREAGDRRCGERPGEGRRGRS